LPHRGPRSVATHVVELALPDLGFHVRAGLDPDDVAAEGITALVEFDTHGVFVGRPGPRTSSAKQGLAANSNAV
jgi:hypothetical protein